jgi:hypothetical protein
MLQRKVTIFFLVFSGTPVLKSLIRAGDGGCHLNGAYYTLFFFLLALQPQFGPWPTSTKLSVSLRLTKSQTFGRTPWAGDQLVSRPLPVHKHKKKRAHPHTHTQTPNIHALSGIQTHSPGFQSSEDSACLK